jgi:hypothetical protein
MCLQPGPVLGFDPHDQVVVTGAGGAVDWLRTIPDFGWYPEIYVLFLATGGRLLRAAWLGSAAVLDDFVAWPDFSLGYSPPGGAETTILVVCRPGEGVEPTADDWHVFSLLRLAHAARGVPLADVVLVDGRRWHPMAPR